MFLTFFHSFGYGSYSISYHYRLTNWFWFGCCFNTIPTGDGHYVPIDYNIQYSIAPSIRFSYLNRPNATLYSGLSTGVGVLEKEGDWVYYERSRQLTAGIFFQLTVFGFSVGEKFFVGGEIGVGFKGLWCANVGYRF